MSSTKKSNYAYEIRFVDDKVKKKKKNNFSLQNIKRCLLLCSFIDCSSIRYCSKTPK